MVFAFTSQFRQCSRPNYRKIVNHRPSRLSKTRQPFNSELNKSAATLTTLTSLTASKLCKSRSWKPSISDKKWQLNYTRCKLRSRKRLWAKRDQSRKKKRYQIPLKKSPNYQINRKKFKSQMNLNSWWDPSTPTSCNKTHTVYSMISTPQMLETLSQSWWWINS